ncbi:DNA -binding domain-containing protein [Rhizobium johnstonii]
MSAKIQFLDQPPTDARLTDYDRAHLVTYLRLLDAESEGAPWQEVAKIVFGLNAIEDPDRAKRVHESHLARAHWMTTNGYRDLLRSSFH